MAIGDMVKIGDAKIGGFKCKSGVITLAITFSADSFPCQTIGELAKIDRKDIYAEVTIEPHAPRIDTKRAPVEDPSQLKFEAVEEEKEIDADFEVAADDEPLAEVLPAKPKRGRPKRVV